MTLRTKVEELPGVGPATARALRELGVSNLGKLLTHLPFKHEQHEAEGRIDEVTAGAVSAARGTVTATRMVGVRPRSRFEAALEDDTGRLDLVWFNAPYLREKIHPGARLLVQGKAVNRSGRLQMANPKFELLREGAEPPAKERRLRPVYPASEALPSGKIEALVQRVLARASALIDDHLDEAYRAARDLPELGQAYRWMHAPESPEQAAAARRRLAYDELLLLQLALATKRHERHAALRAPALACTPKIDQRIRARLPFELTPHQAKVIGEVAADLGKDRPANRLIQGDVGAGKTVVALYAMLIAVAAKRQAAMMAPTELLAQQHAAGLRAMLKGSEVRLELLTGGVGSAERARVERGVARGEVDIVVGTHALLTERVAFSSLALVVIDEQHRFGVHQRAKLREKGAAGPAEGGAKPGAEGGQHADGPTPAGRTPHVLVMTATPIPRTLAMTLLGDLDVSTIAALPPGRQPIKTRLVGPESAPEVYAWVRTRLEAGEQAYVVAPTIEAGDEPGALASVAELKERLERGPLAGRSLALMHGQLPGAERERVMKAFRAGSVDVLVATSVIEVGVDVPNATVMVVEHAERFGLAQLHQLRGRVGRGSKRSYCVLVARPTTDEATARLAALVKSSDGFALAEADLKIRGFGDVVGVRQSGMPPFKVADLSKDLDLLTLARRDADAWIERSPALGERGEALVRSRMLKAHGRWLDLGGTG
jgi:ATP-dependent DNA helicase RecG